jgi:hypothetical protein
MNPKSTWTIWSSTRSPHAECRSHFLSLLAILFSIHNCSRSNAPVYLTIADSISKDLLYPCFEPAACSRDHLVTSTEKPTMYIICVHNYQLLWPFHLNRTVQETEAEQQDGLFVSIITSGLESVKWVFLDPYIFSPSQPSSRDSHVASLYPSLLAMWR